MAGSSDPRCGVVNGMHAAPTDAYFNTYLHTNARTYSNCDGCPIPHSRTHTRTYRNSNCNSCLNLHSRTHTHARTYSNCDGCPIPHSRTHTRTYRSRCRNS